MYSRTVKLTLLFIGDVGTDHQSGAFASIVVRIQGTVRTVGLGPDDDVLQVESRFVTRWACGGTRHVDNAGFGYTI